MSFTVPSIVEGVYEQNSIMSSVGVDDWTAERAIIASDVYQIFLFYEYCLISF